jgi:hypothetical protein
MANPPPRTAGAIRSANGRIAVGSDAGLFMAGAYPKVSPQRQQRPSVFMEHGRAGDRSTERLD